MDDIKQNENKDLHIWLLVGLAIAAILICMLFFLLVIKYIDEWPNRGLFGDMFGALNALFSGLAFAGVIYAILLQRKELELQREEMKLSREELAQQNKIISEQLKTMYSSYEFQRQREYWDSEPVIKCVGGERNYGITKLTISNYGARITQLKGRILNPKNNITIRILSGDVLDHNGTSVLILSDDCEDIDVVLEISYTTRMGLEESKLFRMPKASLALIPINNESGI